MLRAPVTRGLLAATLLTASFVVAAQPPPSFPSRPVSIIVPYSPGGETDEIARKEFAAFLNAENDKWGAIIRARNIKLE